MSFTTVKKHRRKVARGRFITIRKHRRDIPSPTPIPTTPRSEFRGRHYFVDSGPHPAVLGNKKGNVRYFHNPNSESYEVWFTKQGVTPYKKGNSIFFAFKTQKSAKKLMNQLRN